jgi:hypothetical protein
MFYHVLAVFACQDDRTRATHAKAKDLQQAGSEELYASQVRNSSPETEYG